MFEYIDLVLDFLPARLESLILGFLAVFGIFVICKVVILLKDIILRWL